MTRKLNLQFAKDIGKAGGAAGLAVLTEELAVSAIVGATVDDGKVGAFDIAVQIVVGWAPLVFAATRPPGSAFWNAFGGAVACNRVDNLMVALGQRALTPVGAVRAGETIDSAQRRLGYS